MSEHMNSPAGENSSSDGRVGAGDSAQTRSASKGPRRGVLIGGIAAGVLVVGGVAAVAGSDMLGGGGAQPEEVLPGESIVFTKVDLDPGAAQKVGAFRLMDKIPQAKDALNSGDPKKALFEWLKSTDEDLADIDYAQDVEPWLGDRAAFAMLAAQGSSTEPVMVAAVAVKDEAKAREGIARLEAKGKDALDNAKAQADDVTKAIRPTASPTGSDQETVQIFKDGYMLLLAKKDERRVRAALEQPALSANETFTEDMAAIGETGVASGWINGPEALKLSGGTSTPAAMEELAGLSGRNAYALRFASDHLEVAQVNRGMQLKTQAAPLQDVTNLPPNTGAFYSFSGGSAYLGELWPMIKKFAGAGGMGDIDEQLKQVEQQTGLALPQDAQTLLGDQFDVVVAQQDFTKLQAMPQVGLRLWTDTAKAQSMIGKLTKLAEREGGALPLVTSVSGEHLDVALDQGYLNTLATGGTVSQSPGFATVLPGLDKSVGALYVNLDAYESQYLDQVPADQRELVKALQAVGVTSQPITNGEQHSTLRLSVN